MALLACGRFGPEADFSVEEIDTFDFTNAPRAAKPLLVWPG
jgi:hypothetical protein